MRALVDFDGGMGPSPLPIPLCAMCDATTRSEVRIFFVVGNEDDEVTTIGLFILTMSHPAVLDMVRKLDDITFTEWFMRKVKHC